MNHPSRTCLAAGLALLASLAASHAAEPTAQYWHELGAGSASGAGISHETSGDAGPPAAVVNPSNGHVFVAWESANSEIFVRKWTGAEWTEIGNSATGGGISNNTGASRFPSIALAGDGTPVVAWLDDSSGNWEVYLRKFNPTSNAWVGFAGSAEGGGVSKAAGDISQPEGALPSVGAAGGGLLVAWAKNAPAERHVFVSALGTAGWTALGGSVDGVEYETPASAAGDTDYLGASDPSLAIGPDNAPVVAYVTKSTTSRGDIHVRRWSGSAWAPLGTGAATNGGISAHASGTEYQLSRPRLLFAPNGHLHAGWLYADAGQSLASVKRLENGAWVHAGPALTLSGALFQSGISLGFAPDGSALLAWAQELPTAAPVGNSEIYVSKLVRSNVGTAQWQEFGTGSASGGGVSSTSGNSSHPAIALARPASTAPVIVWAEATATAAAQATQLYVRRAHLPANVVEFAKATYSTKEGAPPATIQVVRRGNLAGESRVRYATHDNTATAGADYTAVEGELVFGPSESVKSFTVEVAQDNLAEPSETVTLILSNPSVAGGLGPISQASLVITDNPPPTTAAGLRFRHPGIVLGEGAGRAVLEVTREGNTAVEASVDYATVASNSTVAGAATPNADYTPVSGTLRFEAGITSRSFEVPVIDDELVEGKEGFSVRLSNPSAGAVLATPATCNILIEDNDQTVNPAGALQFRVANQAVSEGAGHATIEVVRVNGSSGEVTIHYETVLTAAGAATPDADYSPVNGTLTFGDGVVSRTFQVPILEDTLVEPTESFAVRLSAPTGGAVLGTPVTAAIHITDNDGTTAPASLVQFNPVEYSTSEAAGSVTLRIVRSGDTSGAAAVDYFTPEVAIAQVGVATPGTDYEVTSGTVNFAPGETQKTITVIILADDQPEPNEHFPVSLRNPVGASLGQAVSAKVVIASESATQPGVLAFAKSEFRTVEDSPHALITVTRRFGTSGEVSVRYETAPVPNHPRPATENLDYTPVSGLLTFAAGEQTQTFSVPILQDSLVEGTEGVLLILSEPTGATLAEGGSKAMLIIADDDQAAGRLQFAGSTAQTREGAASISLMVVRKDGAAGEVSVNYATADGTATADADYEGRAGTLTFAAGQQSTAVSIPIKKDARKEGPETFTVTLSEPTGGAILGTPVSVTVTIVDSESAGVIQFYRSDYISGERAGTALITVIRSEGAAGEVSVSYATHDGTALDGEDYTTVSGTLIFAHGQRTKTFTVPIINDTTPEAAETVNLSLSAPTGDAVLGARAMAVLHIADDDPAAKLQFASMEFRVREDHLAGHASIRVIRRGSTARAATVHYTTSDGTAIAGEDYTATSGVLEFLPGQFSKTFHVPLIRDEVVEGLESVHLTLGEPEGAILGTPATAILLIGDPGAKHGSIQFATSQFKVSEAAGVATITVTRAGTHGAVTVKYSASAGTATEGDDFAAVSGVLEFGVGETKKTFTVPIIADALAEEPETILLELSEPTGGALLGTPDRATLTVFDGLLTTPLVTQ